ncbi:MAG: nucleotide exchange factor GrpE [Gammaproteobacteria bacterium]|nr:nucleotide exchange factor GrpE [Gammaproteobacteria bacterium]MDE2345216.1 nucleotide exchange factor GrpE [Gammaproteobacteria bacterium]
MSKPQTEPPAEAAEHGEAMVVDPQGELKSALAEAQQEAARNRDGYLRMAAELDNLRKRAQRDLENAHKYALERFLAELLPVQDSLELGIANADAGEISLKEGMQMTLKLLSTALERAGIRELNPAKGDNFDPELQEAMAMQESSDAAPGTVLQTMQKGYQLNSRLLRPARVIVAKAPGADA